MESLKFYTRSRAQVNTQHWVSFGYPLGILVAIRQHFGAERWSSCEHAFGPRALYDDEPPPTTGESCYMEKPRDEV